MTCTLVTPWWHTRSPATGPASVDGEVCATPVLDWQHPLVAALVERVREDRPDGDVELLRAAHQRITNEVRPVYALDDRQPVSRTLRRRRGSCSQRLAALEAVARSAGIRTRVRGLLVDGSFWYPRFPRARRLVPSRVVLAWPEFRLDDEWVPAAELFGGLRDLAACSTSGFTNADGETLFDALSRTAVDWDGATGPTCDLSANVLGELGHFDSRDALFDAHGQTLCAPITLAADPLLSRWSA